MKNKSILFCTNSLVGLILLILAATPIVILTWPDIVTLKAGGEGHKLSDMALMDRIGVLLVYTPPFIFAVRALFAVRFLIIELAAGRFFSDKTHAGFLTAGKSALWAVLLFIMAEPFASYFATGSIHIHLGVEVGTLSVVVVAMLFYLLAKAISAGQRQQAELRDII